jgi:hypothetical protein
MLKLLVKGFPLFIILSNNSTPGPLPFKLRFRDIEKAATI